MRQLLKKVVAKRLEHYTKELLKAKQPVVVAVTGSVGKTSTKLAIAHILARKHRVLFHFGNYNTEFGLPLSLFELEAPKNISSIMGWLAILGKMRAKIKTDYPYDVVILEMGADKPGDITNFTNYIRPNIGVITAVAKVHLEEFQTIEAILQEKWELARASKVVIYNHDDARLVSAAANIPNANGYGLNQADFWSEANNFGKLGWAGKLHLRDQTYELTFPVAGLQSIYALTAAAAVARQLELTDNEIVAGIESWQQPSGRMRPLKGKNDTTILDDSYNSNPYAATAALDTLRQYPGRKIAILGSMNELGDYEVAGHRLVGKYCRDLDMLVTIGQAANKYIVEAALESGLKPSKIHECNSPYQAGDTVAAALKPGDTVLVKGSQNGVLSEEAIKPLLADATDVALLVRQSQRWLEVKQEQFS